MWLYIAEIYFYFTLTVDWNYLINHKKVLHSKHEYVILWVILVSLKDRIIVTATNFCKVIIKIIQILQWIIQYVLHIVPILFLILFYFIFFTLKSFVKKHRSFKTSVFSTQFMLTNTWYLIYILIHYILKKLNKYLIYFFIIETDISLFCNFYIIIL